MNEWAQSRSPTVTYLAFMEGGQGSGRQSPPEAEAFLRATAVPAGTAEARISYGNSVCLSVRPSVRPSICHNRVVYQAQMR